MVLMTHHGRPATAAALVLLTALLVAVRRSGCVLAAAVAVTPTAGSEVPSLDLAVWNMAYKITYANIVPRQQTDGIPAGCQPDRPGIRPSAVELDSCYWRQHSNGTYSYWRKAPGEWRQNTNCYCYALNAFKQGYCVPSKLLDTDVVVTCDLVREAVVADGARLVTRDEAMGGQPSSGHYIAMLARQDGCGPHHCWENDFHAVRKDSNNLWSWKEPSGPAYDRDLFGSKIADPEVSILPGHYDQFCGYFQVWPDNMTIQGVLDQESIADWVEGAAAGEQAVLSVWAEPTSPYNQTVDGAFSADSVQLQAEDRLWGSTSAATPSPDSYTSSDAGGSFSSNSSSSNSGSLPLNRMSPNSRYSGRSNPQTATLSQSSSSGSTSLRTGSGFSGGRKMLNI